ncbi:hypothetical protein [Bradyrhizobium altum]|uniref:hypothetical protein n=1 Tax=Bradyrhizobium altum TaxID=1571202 RepID=UPI002896A265|nr:hypothetical protein [Bradyrhizobium altum]
MTAALRRDGIDVDMMEDASKDDMRHAIDRLRSNIGLESIVILFSAAMAFRPAAREPGSQWMPQI